MIPGVVEVRGDVTTKRLDVSVNEETEAGEIVRALERIGYSAEA